MSNPGQVTFDLVADLTDHPVVTVSMMTPAGSLRFMANLEMNGSIMILSKFHIQGALANAVGVGNLKMLARIAMERMELDGLVINGLVIKGAARTSGPNEGRRPGVLWFSRSAPPDVE
jgi:hypothetical protein